MPKVSELRTANQIAAEELADPEIRREHERTALAHEVAMRVIGYRLDHGLSQTGLARRLGMHQPAIARLEAGDHEPSLARGTGACKANSSSSATPSLPRCGRSCTTPGSTPHPAAPARPGSNS